MCHRSPWSLHIHLRIQGVSTLDRVLRSIDSCTTIGIISAKHWCFETREATCAAPGSFLGTRLQTLSLFVTSSRTLAPHHCQYHGTDRILPRIPLLCTLGFRLLCFVTHLKEPSHFSRPELSTMGGRARCQNQFFMTRCAYLMIVQDGLSIVCVILRHVENESIDYDTLLYCYLKVRLYC